MKILSTIIAFIGILTFSTAQTISKVVIMGSENSNPTESKGALLQLKQNDTNDSTGGDNATKGLLLPRVNITDSATLTIPGGDATKLTGLVVYNIKDASAATNQLYKGLVLWNGTKWIQLTKE